MIDDILASFPPSTAATMGQRRQAAVWRGEEPDSLPILIGGAAPDSERFPRYSLGEQYRDPNKMLVGQLLGALNIAWGHSDAVPSFRVNFGCSLLATLIGLEQRVFEEQMPWLVEHCPKEQPARLARPGDADGPRGWVDAGVPGALRPLPRGRRRPRRLLHRRHSRPV